MPGGGRPVDLRAFSPDNARPLDSSDGGAGGSAGVDPGQRERVDRRLGVQRGAEGAPRSIMLWTLQWYIFRELGKTFLLTAIGMTAILGMGGGVLNIIELQQVTAGQLLRIMAIVFPVAATLALPVAALFSAAVTYGRLSADNEFVACRASGVNIHRLFAPTVLISLVAALLTFLSINYVIPSRIRNLDQFLKADLSRIVLYQLQAPGRLSLFSDRYRIYAEDPRIVDHPELPGDSEELLLGGVALVEMAGENWVRYGTAESVWIRFDKLDSEPTLQAEFRGLAYYDRGAKQWSELERQPFEGKRIRRELRLRVKWFNLGELFHYGYRLEELPEVGEGLQNLRALLAREYFYRSLWEDFRTPDPTGQPDCKLTFGDDKMWIVLQAEALIPGLDDYKPTFEEVSVVETTAGKVRRATAGGGTIVDGDDTRPIQANSYTMGPVTVSAEVVAKVAALSDRELLNPPEAGGLVTAGPIFRKKQSKVIEDRSKFYREILGVIHSRLAYSISTFALVILGAALGIILRGSHVLTAFGISFVPSVFVIMTIIMGRQVAQNAGTTGIGVCIIWAGIVLVSGVDVWTLTRVLKR